jgi:predicted dehydrogenase
MTLAAIAAGKHVFCEKPLAMNAKEAQEMFLRAKDACVTHMVAHEFRFAPARRYARELIDEGYIGDLRHVQVSLFVRSAGQGPRPWGWSADAALGGSWLGALGSHYIDALRFLFGDITAVSGFVQTLEPDRIVPETNEVRKATADDMFNFTARFARGGHATMVGTNVFHGGSGARIEIYGSDGSLVLDQGQNVNPPTHGKLLGCKRGESELRDLPVPAKYLPFDVEGDARMFQFVLEVQEFVRGIHEGVEVAPSLYDGFRCQQVIDAIRESSKSRCWVDIPETM